jgi:hypothetical protein
MHHDKDTKADKDYCAVPCRQHALSSFLPPEGVLSAARISARGLVSNYHCAIATFIFAYCVSVNVILVPGLQIRHSDRCCYLRKGRRTLRLIILDLAAAKLFSYLL